MCYIIFLKSTLKHLQYYLKVLLITPFGLLNRLDYFWKRIYLKVSKEFLSQSMKCKSADIFSPDLILRNIIQIASARSALLVQKCANKAPTAFVGVQVVEKLQPQRFAPIHITIFPSAVPAGEQNVDSAQHPAPHSLCLLDSSQQLRMLNCKSHCGTRLIAPAPTRSRDFCIPEKNRDAPGKTQRAITRGGFVLFAICPCRSVGWMLCKKWESNLPSHRFRVCSRRFCLSSPTHQLPLTP